MKVIVTGQGVPQLVGVAEVAALPLDDRAVILDLLGVGVEAIPRAVVPVLDQDAVVGRRGVAVGNGNLGDGPVLEVIAVVALILDDLAEVLGCCGAKV